MAVGASGDRVMTAGAGFGEDTPITLFVDENATTSSSTATTLTYGLNHDAGTTTITADLYADTLYLTKPSMGSSSNEIYLSDADFYDNSDDSDILFIATTSTSTVNADLYIASGTIVFAPQHLVIDGDFDNQGTFYAERGEVIADSSTFDLETPQYFTGNFTATSSLHDLTNQSNLGLTLPYFTNIQGDFTSAGITTGLEGSDIFLSGTNIMGAWDTSHTVANFILEPGSVTVFDTDLTVGDLTIGVGAGVAAADNMIIRGDLTQDGLFVASTSNLTFSGASSTLSGTMTGTSTLGDVTLAPGGDGSQWLAVSAVGNNDEWQDVAYGNGIYVAVGDTDAGTNDAVMTSPDGITWTARTAAGDDDFWSSVTYGNGLFVAVGSSGDRVMTSPDGITWTNQSAAGNNDPWFGVTYGNGLFVAVGFGLDRVMTSPDGITWTARSAAGDDDFWSSVTYANGLFVAVGASGDDRVMVSATSSLLFADNASTSDFTVEKGTTTAPSLLTVGDFTNNGSFNSNNGTIYSTGAGTFDARRVQLRASITLPVGVGAPSSLYVSPEEGHFYMVSSSGDDVNWYEMITPGDLSTVISRGSLSESGIESITFRPDGTRMYLGYASTPEVAQYDLSTPWDLGTAVFSVSTSLSGAVDTEETIRFKPDGRVLYVVDSSGVLTQYNLDAPWDISNVTDAGTFALFDTRNLEFNRTGDRLNAWNDSDLREYIVRTPWDITTLESQNFIFYDVLAQGFGSDLQELTYNGTQDTLYGVTRERNIVQYDVPAIFRGTLTGNSALSDIETVGGYTLVLDTASTSDVVVAAGAEFEVPVSAMSVDGSLVIDGKLESVNNQGELHLTGTGQTVTGNVVGSSTLGNVTVVGSYTISDNASTSNLTISAGASLTAPVGELTIAGDYSNSGTFTANAGTVTIRTPQPSLDGYVYVDSFEFSPYDTDVRGTAISEDGTILYVTGAAQDALFWSALAVPYDVTTAGVPESTTLTTWLTTPDDIMFSPDGARMFIASEADDEVASFTLDPAWDASSLSFVATTSFSGLTTAFFSNDGTKFYSTRFNSSRINAYDLSVAWDLSTAVLVDQQQARTDLGIMYAADVTNDGSKVFLMERDGGIAEVGLDVPFDLSSIDRTVYKVGVTEIDRAQSFAFSADQKYLYVGDYADDEIDQFQVISDPVAMGTMTDASAFNNLTQDTVLPMTFAGSASTTGTFAIIRSDTALAGATTTVFNADSSYTFQNINWQGSGASSTVSLRSSASGTAWYLNVPGSQINVEYVDVQDSNASLGPTIVSSRGIDSGNNINWNLAAPEWNDDEGTPWHLYDTITIDHNTIDESLGNFPVYVDLADLSPMFGFIAGSCGSIRVTTDGPNPVELPRELVSCDLGSETGELHFKADFINKDADTSFRIYYSPDLIPDYQVDQTYGAQNVWTNDFVGVWHMHTDPVGSAAVLDSTMNMLHGSSGPSTASDDLVSGKMGNALNFDAGPSDYVNIGSDSKLDNMSTWTMCTWYEHDSFPAQYVSLIDKSANANQTDGSKLYLRDNGNFGAWSIQQNHSERPATTGESNWQYLCGTWNGGPANGDVLSYKNGVDLGGAGADNGGTFDDSDHDMYFGIAGVGAAGLDGRLDEVRIASTVRSAAWIKAEYLNQSTTTNFYRLSSGNGSSTISNHDAGQIDDAFNFQSKFNEPLFAFKLTPESGSATVTSLTIDLSGAREVSVDDFSGIHLCVDSNNNGTIGATDFETCVIDDDINGTMTANGQFGSITFDTDFLVTTATNYVVIAIWNAPGRGAQLNFDLYPSGVRMLDAGGGVAVTGSVDRIQHNRAESRGGGGGSSAAVGDPAPEGDGDVGGGEIDGGELIGNDPDFRWPTGRDFDTDAWSFGQLVYDQVDGTYASAFIDGNIGDYINFDHNVPGSDSIVGIEVKLEVIGNPGNTIDVQLSWDGGTTFTAPKNSGVLTDWPVEGLVTLGGSTDLWGRSWTAEELNDENFMFRMTANIPDSASTLVDALQVRVYHQASGGGGGGGGAI